MTINWTKTGGSSWRVTFTDPPEPTALDVWMQDSGMNTYLSAFPSVAQPRGYATRSETVQDVREPPVPGYALAGPLRGVEASVRRELGPQLLDTLRALGVRI